MLENKEFILEFVENYGYIGLYFLFIIDTLGLFLPSKTMLMISGFLVSQGYLKHIPLVIATLSGSLTGFFTGYLIGIKAGKPFLDKYGRLIHLTPERLVKTEIWFAKYGAAAILVAYFLPGVRHIIPYLCGISKMPFRIVMFYASIGATLWILTFSSIGRFLGNKLPVLLDNIAGDYALEVVGFVVIIVSITFLIWKGYKHPKKISKDKNQT